MHLSPLFDRLDTLTARIGATLGFIAGNAVILPRVAEFERLSGGRPMLELPSQLSGNLLELARTYPPEAAAYYREVLLLLDIPYPATAGFFFFVMLVALTRRVFSPGSRWLSLPWLGVAMVSADWAENLGVFTLLTDPAAPDAVEVMTRGAIALKFGTGSLTVLVTLGLFVYAAAQRVRLGRWPATQEA